MDADKDAAHLAAKLSTFLEQQLQGFEKKTRISRQKKSRSAPILGHIDPLPKPKTDRARPRKPHENTPFLGINLVPPEKQTAEAEAPQPKQKSNKLNVPLSRPGSTTTRATRASQTGRVTSAASTRRGPSRQSRATYGSVAGDFIKFPNAVPFHKSPVVTTPLKANKHIKSPFKQTANTIELEVTNVAPGQDLKEKTALATYHVSRVLAQQPVTQDRKQYGRLRKGKLKPLLEPVILDGPSIEQCRGIVADAHCYKPSPSKSSLRREQLLNSLTKDYIRERPRTAESMHHTSEASDTEDRERELDDEYDQFGDEEPEDEDYIYYDVELDENVAPPIEDQAPPVDYDVDMSHISGAEITEENPRIANTPAKELEQDQPQHLQEQTKLVTQAATEKTPDVTVTRQTRPSIGSAKTILRDPKRPGTAPDETGRKGSAKTVRFKGLSSETSTIADDNVGATEQEVTSKATDQSEASVFKGQGESGDTNKRSPSSNTGSKAEISEHGKVMKSKEESEKYKENTDPISNVADQNIPNEDLPSENMSNVEMPTQTLNCDHCESQNKIPGREKSESDEKKLAGRVSCKDDVIDDDVKKRRDEDDDEDGGGGFKGNDIGQINGQTMTPATQTQANGGGDNNTSQSSGVVDSKENGGNHDCDSSSTRTDTHTNNEENELNQNRGDTTGSTEGDVEKGDSNVITQDQFQSYIRGHAEMAMQFSQFLIDKNHYQKFSRRPNSATMNVKSRPSSGKKDSVKKRPSSAGVSGRSSPNQKAGRTSPRKTVRPGSSGRRPGSALGFVSPRSPEKDQGWVTPGKAQKGSPRKGDSHKSTKSPVRGENGEIMGKRTRTRSQPKRTSPKKENVHLKRGDIFLHSSRVSDQASGSTGDNGTGRQNLMPGLHIDLSNVDGEGYDRTEHALKYETFDNACGICGLEADMCVCPNSTLKPHPQNPSKSSHYQENLEEFDDDELGIYEDSGESDAEIENLDTILTLEEMENSLSQVQLDINRKCVGLEKMNRIIESSLSVGDQELDDTEDLDMLKLDINSIIKDVAPEVMAEGVATHREDTERFWMSTDCKRLLASYRFKCMAGGTECAEISSTLVVPESHKKDDADDTVVFLSNRGQDGMTQEKVVYSSRREKDTTDTIDLVAKETALRNQDKVDKTPHSSRRSACHIDFPKKCQSLALDQSFDNVSDSGCGSEAEQSLFEDNDGHNRGGSAADSVLDKDFTDSELDKKDAATEEESLPDVTGLKVIATTKALSAPSRCDKPSEDDQTPVAPYPPICFRINARPPEGHLYYFAYGTDMNPNRFSTYVRKKSCTRLWGLLFGFQLKFNKRGADIEAGGFPNIDFNPFSSVEGVVYTITHSELGLLDQCIGYPEHYEHVMVPVWMCNSTDPNALGVAQYCIPAVTYVAQEKWVTRDEYPLEYEYNLHQCLKSCDMLSPAYKQHLFRMQGSAHIW